MSFSRKLLVAIIHLAIFMPAAFAEWQPVFYDEFNRSELGPNWSFRTGTRRADSSKTNYKRENIVLKNGWLNLYVKEQESGTALYSGGLVHSSGKIQSLRYGRFSARVRYKMKGPGFWCNFWMCGVDRWPPEFDLEITSNHMDQIYCGHHYLDESGEHSESAVHIEDIDYSKWHIYTHEWIKGEPVRFYIDGKLVYTSQADHNNPSLIDMYMIIRAGSFYNKGWGGFPDYSTQYPGIMQVDWVKILKQAEIE